MRERQMAMPRFQGADYCPDTLCDPDELEWLKQCSSEILAGRDIDGRIKLPGNRRQKGQLGCQRQFICSHICSLELPAMPLHSVCERRRQPPRERPLFRFGAGECQEPSRGNVAFSVQLSLRSRSAVRQHLGVRRPIHAWASPHDQNSSAVNHIISVPLSLASLCLVNSDLVCFTTARPGFP